MRLSFIPVPQADEKVNRLLVICGPTATGKTSLAVNLAKKFNAEIISADSRQVYKYMNIGTGKDLPKDAKYKVKDKNLGGFYQLKETKIWGYDLAHPRQGFSVAEYVGVARKIIKDIWQRGNLPILVGGTGFYIQGVVDGISTASIPKNEELRESLEGRKTGKLFEQLAQLDPIKAGSMNMSDRKNPRRLIRAIEIAQWELKRKGKRKEQVGKKFVSEDELFFVGLTAKRKILCERIKKRVKTRIKAGIKQEIKELLEMKVVWDMQAMNSLGYKQWEGYFKGNKRQKEVVLEWIKDECNYAKRQMTWFKKDKRIEWFDITKSNFSKNVEKLVKSWYNTNS